MLYKIREGVSVFEDNPELLTIPEFAKLYSTTAFVKNEDRDRRMRYVMLVADRRSPLRSLPEKQRREKATLIAGWGKEGNRPDKNAREIIAGKITPIEEAIVKYREYQYDEHQDTLDTVNKQIDEIKEYLKSDKTKARDYGKALEQAAKLGEKLVGLVETKLKLESLLQISTEEKPEVTTYSSYDIPEETLNSDEPLSTIEQYHQSRK